MTNKEAKNLIELSLRAFKIGSIDEEYATRSIINAICDSWYFNYNSFILGSFVGAIIMLIAKSFSV